MSDHRRSVDNLVNDALRKNPYFREGVVRKAEEIAGLVMANISREAEYILPGLFALDEYMDIGDMYDR